MNGLLLDTNILLWAANGNLAATVLARLQNETHLYVSVASMWEVAIKVGLGKLQLDMSMEDLIGAYLSRSGMESLPFSNEDIQTYASLPFVVPDHRDPFDRMLVVQASTRGLVLLTSDPALRAYGTFVDVV